MGPAHWKLHVVSNGRCSSIDPLESYGSLMMDTLFWGFKLYGTIHSHYKALKSQDVFFNITQIVFN